MENIKSNNKADTKVSADNLAETWRNYTNKTIAAEISSLSRYCDNVIQYKPRKEDTLALLNAIDCQEKQTFESAKDIPKSIKKDEARSLVLLNANTNHDYDIENTLSELKPALGRGSRVALVSYNPYFRLIYKLANKLGIRKGAEPTTFITRTDIENLARLSGFDLVRNRQAVYVPFALFGIGTIINKLFSVIPLIKWLSLVNIIVLRPIVKSEKKPSLSIVIPARNEKGNIENALKRMPDFGGAELEVIYVEGNSTEDTWDEVQRVVKKYNEDNNIKYKISCMQQTGKGKNDAVRLGFKHARNELLTILDADLTMPPELLTRFYDAYCRGDADFINGSRLVYPMEGEAMRFLNRLGNIFFSKALSYVLGTRLSDTLCGTKLVSQTDYKRILNWRDDFGDFDPFGDYELIFPACVLSLGIIDIPIRYRDRTYGSTNISRFRHGAMLLKMTMIGFFRLRLAKTV